ncbi:MAG: MFS transporter [Parachlamydiaceae bacterium]|nr:MFS transporter [Parachlamydiaceae bacterium]
MLEPQPFNHPSSNRKALISWAFYDWGTSAFATLIQTFVFAAYFVNKVAADPASGAAVWGFITGLSALIVAIMSPFIGAAADQSGGRKVWLACFTLLAIICTALLWFVQPSPNYVPLALILIGFGSVGAEGAYVFYNAILPVLAKPSEIGRWSGWGWGMGYFGGTIALVFCLAFLNDQWFGSFLSPLKEVPEGPLRATFLFAAAWILFFSWPILFFTPQSPPRQVSLKRAFSAGAHQLWSTLKKIYIYKNIVRFLIAKLFYVDGLATLFAFGGIYAASVFDMTSQEVLEFGISLNVTAGIGAFIFAHYDDRFGSKRMILLSLIGLIIPGTLAIIAVSKWQFWLLGIILGIFVGPVQSSSRAFMARIAPPHLRNEMFGFYMLSGKATAFFGPLLYGWITYLSGSLRWGMSSVIFLFIIGGLIMLTVSEEKIEG